MKVIRISDETHERLKQQAKNEGRHLQVFTEQVVEAGLKVLYETVQMTVSTEKGTQFISSRSEDAKLYDLPIREDTPPLGRKRSEIEADIARVNTEYAEQAAFIQDAGAAIELEKKRITAISKLDDELEQAVM